MSNALRSAFSLYVKLNVGGFVGGDQRMNSNQFTKMCQDAGIMEPNGASRAVGTRCRVAKGAKDPARVVWKCKTRTYDGGRPCTGTAYRY